MASRLAALALAAFAFAVIAARAEPPPLKIGVLTDASGPYVDSGGQGSVVAAEMAAKDFGGEVLGRKIEIVLGDTLNKPDVAVGIARRWFDVEGVSAVTDLPVTPVAFSVQALAKEKNRTVLITAGATTDITAKYCSIGSSHWADDTHAMATSIAKAVTASGAKTWFFLTVDTAFGAALQKATTGVVEKAGGKVLGSVKYPINAPDFSSQLLQAQASGADRIALASVGADLDNQIKQGAEFGIGKDGKQAMVGFLIYIQSVHAIGLATAQNLNLTSGFFGTRATNRGRLRSASSSCSIRCPRAITPRSIRRSRIIWRRSRRRGRTIRRPSARRCARRRSTISAIPRRCARTGACCTT